MHRFIVSFVNIKCAQMIALAMAFVIILTALANVTVY